MTFGDLKTQNPQERFAVVLVETEQSLNIGSVARAMMNLGFKDLRLAAPRNYVPAKAAVTARWASLLLDGMREFDTLEAAVADCDDVVGFGIKPGLDAKGNLLLGEWLEALPADPSTKVALVFGPEDTGLTKAHYEQCRSVVRIPSAGDYQSFNLAQSVLIALYELSRAGRPTRLDAPPVELPTWNEFYQLDRIVGNVLELSKFYRKGSPEPIPGFMKSMFRRMQPDRREMGILLAMFGRLERCLRREETSDSERAMDERVSPDAARK